MRRRWFDTGGPNVRIQRTAKAKLLAVRWNDWLGVVARSVGDTLIKYLLIVISEAGHAA